MDYTEIANKYFMSKYNDTTLDRLFKEFHMNNIEKDAEQFEEFIKFNMVKNALNYNK